MGGGLFRVGCWGVGCLGWAVGGGGVGWGGWGVGVKVGWDTAGSIAVSLQVQKVASAVTFATQTDVVTVGRTLVTLTYFN